MAKPNTDAVMVCYVYPTKHDVMALTLNKQDIYDWQTLIVLFLIRWNC